jgi:hypothetical protein
MFNIYGVINQPLVSLLYPRNSVTLYKQILQLTSSHASGVCSVFLEELPNNLAENLNSILHLGKLETQKLGELIQAEILKTHLRVAETDTEVTLTSIVDVVSSGKVPTGSYQKAGFSKFRPELHFKCLFISVLEGRMRVKVHGNLYLG